MVFNPQRHGRGGVHFHGTLCGRFHDDAPLIRGQRNAGLRLHVEMRLATVDLRALQDLAGAPIHASGPVHNPAVKRIFLGGHPVKAAARTRNLPDVRSKRRARRSIREDAAHRDGLLQIQIGFIPFFVPALAIGWRGLFGPHHRVVGDAVLCHVQGNINGVLLGLGQHHGNRLPQVTHLVNCKQRLVSTHSLKVDAAIFNLISSDEINKGRGMLR